MNKLLHCQLIRKEYLCKFNILGPVSGSRRGTGPGDETMKMYFLPSEEIVPKVKTRVNKNRRMIFKDHKHKS